MTGRTLTDDERFPEPDDRDFNLCLAESWQQLAALPRRRKPERLTVAELDALSPRARARYNELRAVWHANIGPLPTDQVTAICEEFDDLVDTNRQDGGKVKPPLVLDAYPGLGKTTITVRWALSYHRAQIDKYGATVKGHPRIPVAFISLTSNTTMRTLQAMLCDFYNAPSERGNQYQLAKRAAKCIRTNKTKVIVVDDVHFLDFRTSDGRAVANGFKWMSTLYPVTFVFVGVGVDEKGLIAEGLVGNEARMAQTKRRLTTLSLEPFHIQDPAGRASWRKLLLGIEKNLVLADSYPGMVANDLAGYLYARSSGHFASLMTLIARGCTKAIKTKQERLTPDLLDKVKNDVAAEEARVELESALAQGLLIARDPQPSRPDAA